MSLKVTVKNEDPKGSHFAAQIDQGSRVFILEPQESKDIYLTSEPSTNLKVREIPSPALAAKEQAEKEALAKQNEIVGD